MQRKSFARAKNGGPSGPVSTGNRGPAQTTPKHGKKKAWFQLHEDHGAYMRSLQKGNRKQKAAAANDEE